MVRTLFLLAAAALSGCASLPIETRLRPGPPLKVDAVAVYPVAFRWSEPAYRSFELSHDLVNRLLGLERFAVFGPGEIKILRAMDDNPVASTNLAVVLAERDYSPTAALILRPWMERSVQSDTQALYDDKGRQIGEKRTEHVTVLIHLEVHHSGVRDPLGEVSCKVDLDPFAEREESDPMPEVRDALRRVLDATIGVLDDANRIQAARIRRPLGFAYLWNPRALYDYEEPGRPSLERWLATQDALTRDVTRLARLRFFTPDFTDRTLSIMNKLPGGLWIARVSRHDVDLRGGDVIVEIGGEPALPQVLARRLRAAPPGGKVPIIVRRPADRVKLELPVRD